MPISRAPLDVASRTDRGVSAVGNALVVSSDLSGSALLRSLNGISTSIFFTRAVAVDASFRVRRARRRVYRYFEPMPPAHPDLWADAAGLFRGEIDVRSLGRGLPIDRPAWRTVESVIVTESGSGPRIDVIAPSFVWGMVRKIVGALREIDAGRLVLAQLQHALAGEQRLTLPLAEPEPLVLWEVDLPVEWSHTWDGPTRHQARAWASVRAENRARIQVLDALGEELNPKRPAPTAGFSRLAPTARASGLR
jgi:tRNA pseudouridine38-40 synthase